MTTTAPTSETAGGLARAIRRFLAAAFADERAAVADLDARLIVAAALEVSADEVALRGDRTVPPAAAERAWALARRRAAGEPVARLTGRKGFWSIDLAVAPAVLVPRPDTETVVAAALDWLRDRRLDAPRILDLGTGSGAILLALLTELPGAEGVGVDRDPRAVAVARKNAVSLGLADRVRFLAGDWATAIAGTFHVVVANPPYIETEAIAALADEVRRHDPMLALDGGIDGLEAYRRLAPELERLLTRGGGVFFEVGAGQAPRVATLLAERGFAVGRCPDLAGIERVVVGFTVAEGYPKKALGNLARTG